MNHLEYNNAKITLNFHREYLRQLNLDKTAFNTSLNDALDNIIKSNTWLKFSESRQKMYFNWLASYVCKLHIN